LILFSRKNAVAPLIKPTSGPEDFGLIKRVDLLTAGRQIFATLMDTTNEHGVASGRWHHM